MNEYEEAMMARRNVQRLESAVRENNLKRVRKLYDECGTFEFTARALGNACRFSGADMTRELLSHGATFRADPITGPTGYDLRSRRMGNRWTQDTKYDLFVLPDFDEHMMYSRPVIDDAERAKVLEALCEAREGRLDEILYYAILYGDTVSVEALRKNGVNSVGPEKTAMLAGTAGYAAPELGIYRRDRQDLQSRTQSMSIHELKQLYSRYLACEGLSRIRLFPADTREDQLRKLCSPELFDLMCEGTTLLECVKKSELLTALVDAGNALGLERMLNLGFGKDQIFLEDLIARVGKKAEDNAPILAMLLRALEKVRVPEQKEELLSLSAKAKTAGQMRSTWTFSVLEDGTYRLDRYKGVARDIVIPEQIGKRKVSTLGKGLFTTRGRPQTHIQSVIVPDSIEHLDEGVFMKCSIQSCVLPAGLKKLPPSMFRECGKLTCVEIPPHLESIGDSAFRGCLSLEELEIPQTLQRIDNCAFRGSGLRSICLPPGLRRIGKQAFTLSRIRNVRMSGETAVTRSSFDGCFGLDKIEIYGPGTRAEKGIWLVDGGRVVHVKEPC